LESSSFKASDTINPSHIISAGELVLNAQIGIGAEGKVGACVCVWFRLKMTLLPV
jgi:hypothetical protein